MTKQDMILLVEVYEVLPEMEKILKDSLKL